MPYINASIIMQLLTIGIPSLEQLQKEGEEGRKKIQKATRYLAIVIAVFLAIGVVASLITTRVQQQDITTFEYIDSNTFINSWFSILYMVRRSNNSKRFWKWNINFNIC